MSPRKPRIGIAGQLPPPWGGQNLAIAALWNELRSHPGIEAVLCPFYFTPTPGRVRRPSLGKVFELLRVRRRLLDMGRPRPLEVLLLPVGGPQTVPLIRDFFLLPWARNAARCLALQFHAAGLADRLREQPSFLVRRVTRYLGRADVAFIMAEANRPDPEACGLRDIRVRPHRVIDQNPQASPALGSPEEWLYVGHLGNEKGTPQLIEAMVRTPGNCRLTLVGDPLPPWTLAELQAFAGRKGVSSRVRFVGPCAPERLGDYYRRASLFIFPSVAPYESFGLVLAEAMMWSLPVVASNWRGNGEVLGPGSNWMYDPHEPEGLSRALMEAWRQRSTWPAVGSANRKRYESRYRPGVGPTVAGDLVDLAQESERL